MGGHLGMGRESKKTRRRITPENDTSTYVLGCQGECDRLNDRTLTGLNVLFKE